MQFTGRVYRHNYIEFRPRAYHKPKYKLPKLFPAKRKIECQRLNGFSAVLENPPGRALRPPRRGATATGFGKSERMLTIALFDLPHSGTRLIGPW